jgi:trk system potassium uptake protein TrkH
MFFMILGGINFSLHYLVLTKASFKPYLKSLELRTFLWLMFIFGTITSATLYYHGYHDLLHSIIHGYFQVISIGTSTGFISDNHYAVWPTFLPIFLMMIGLIGACAGSTSGGVKVIRVIVMKQHISREIKRLLHPQGVFPIKISSQVLAEESVSSVWAFIGAYIALFILFWLILLALGMEPITAFSAVISCLTNAGAALASGDCSHLPPTALWVLSFAMLCGRLELFTVLVLFSRQFWRD